MKHMSTIRGLAVGGGWLLGACGTNDTGSVGRGGDPEEPVAEAPLAAAKGVVAPDQRASLGASPAMAQEPIECRDVIEERPCALYSIQLLGNPSMDPVARAKYKAAFGSACYMSEAKTFGCFYKKAEVKVGGKACKHAQMVAAVFGVAPYEDHPETCKATPGTNEEQFTLQVGPDTANVVFIKLENAPVESSMIDVGNGVEVAINGPYRNVPEPPKVKVGGDFYCASGQFDAEGHSIQQRKWILEVNKKTHGGVIHSDLAGFTWPCNDPDTPICTEKTELVDGSPDLSISAQVHHVARVTDLRGCKWGTNSNKNAVVISRKLNRFLWYKYPEAKEVDAVNKVPPHTP